MIKHIFLRDFGNDKIDYNEFRVILKYSSIIVCMNGYHWGGGLGQ